MEGDKKYSAVPPPAALTGGNDSSAKPLDFNDALSKARAIAEKLKQQRATGIPAAAPPVAVPSAGSKRGYRDDEYADDGYGYSSRDDRDSKRGVYDSRMEAPRRYGLGSDERRPVSTSSYLAAEPVIQDEMSVPSHMVGLVIGRSGDNLRKIERLSGAKVQFAEDTGDRERRVSIKGEPDQVKIAKDMIQQVVDDTHANESGGAGPGGAYGGGSGTGFVRSGTTMTVPSSKVGLIIGRGGETIRDLEERSGAKITVTPDTERNGERIVSLVGNDSSIQRARNLIFDIVNEDGYDTQVTSSRDWSAYRQKQQQSEGEGGSGDGAGASAGPGPGAGFSGGSVVGSSHRRHDDSYGGGSYGPPPDRYRGGGGGGGRYNDDRESIQVPTSAVGFIIGRGGETVRALQDQSGARIKVDPNSDTHSHERTINIFGNPDAIALAKQLVMDKVAEGNANRGGQGRFERGGGGGDRHYGGGRYNQNYSSGYQQHHHRQPPPQQQQQQQEEGYDYSQYQQYYGQYGYDQTQQYGGSGSGGQEGQGYQYGGYPYNYEGYGQYAAGSDEKKDGKTEAGDDETRKAPEGETSGGDSAAAAAAKDGGQASAGGDYYAQYYGGGKEGGDQQQQQYSQEAYYQWYQQYYGDSAQQQQPPYDQQQQQQPEYENSGDDGANKEH